MAKAKSGGGITMSKNVSPLPAQADQTAQHPPERADQLGQSTSFKKEQCDTGRAYDGAKLGNELALNVQGGGPGKGRETFRSGSQGTHGPVPVIHQLHETFSVSMALTFQGGSDDRIERSK
jgi:hypothetical protein